MYGMERKSNKHTYSHVPNIITCVVCQPDCTADLHCRPYHITTCTSWTSGSAAVQWPVIAAAEQPLSQPNHFQLAADPNMYNINGSVRFKCAYLNTMTGYGVWLCSFRSMLSILAASVCSQALRSCQGGESVYPSLV